MTGESALVTGAGSGMGLECALHLAGQGYAVYGTVLNAAEGGTLEEKAKERGVSVRVLPMDVRRKEEIEVAVGAVLRESGRIDALVQFAGMGLRGFFEDLSSEEIRQVYDVNLFGVMAVTKAVLPHMRKARSGRMVIASSVAGRMGSMGIGGYASSKFALEGFAECLSLETAPLGVYVSLLEPGLIFTPHFTVNRNLTRRAADPASPYYAWFCQHEKIVDDLLRRNRVTTADVARVVHRILQAKRPKLRYLVGAKAKLVIGLRRHVPGEWFERIYFGLLRRMVVSPHAPGHRLGLKVEGIVSELWRVLRILGWRRILEFRRGRQWGWNGVISRHFMVRGVQTLFNVGLLDALRQGPLDVKAWAEEQELDSRLIVAVCEAMYARRILRKEGPLFSLDEDGRFIAESNLMRGWFELSYGYEDVLYHLESLVRKKKLYQDDVRRNGAFVATGSGLVSMDFYFPMAADVIRRDGYRRVLDIGCGDGTFLRYLCGKIEGLQGVGIDLSPEAVESGRETLRSMGLQDRIQLYQGDASEIGRYKAELAGVDAATTFFVLHELSDLNGSDRLVCFLKNFRLALPGVNFFVFETIRPSPETMREKPGPAIEYFLWHDLSNQAPLSREQWKQTFSKAGMQLVEERNLPFVRTDIYTVQ